MEYRGHQVKNFTINCKFNEEDSQIYSGSVDGSLYVYDILKSEPLKIVKVSNQPLSGLDMHGDGGVGIGTHDGNVFYCKI
jgi:WD40 repeat protein